MLIWILAIPAKEYFQQLIVQIVLNWNDSVKLEKLKLNGIPGQTVQKNTSQGKVSFKRCAN